MTNTTNNTTITEANVAQKFVEARKRTLEIKEVILVELENSELPMLATDLEAMVDQVYPAKYDLRQVTQVITELLEDGDIYKAVFNGHTLYMDLEMQNALDLY